MKILVSGSRGFIGASLVPHLASQGHQVSRLMRGRQASAPDVAWDPARGALEAAALEGFDAVIHLAGESIADGRWTRARKAAIRQSRVQGTRLLCGALAHLTRPPQVVVCASAVGYYGSRGEERLTETSASGEGFLAEVCRAWEAAADPARTRGIRVVHLRTGMVLHPSGGALAKMLPIFRAGLGGTIGSGRQYWSWIALDDLIGAMAHALTAQTLRGPVNAVSPQPLTNAEFTRALGRALRRPTVFPLPAFAARLLFGEMVGELLLASARVEPAALLASGYAFRCPDLGRALAALLQPAQRAQPQPKAGVGVRRIER